MIVGKVQATVLGWADLGDVGFVFCSIPQFRWLYLFQSPKNEELEDFCAVHFQQLPEVEVELVVVDCGSCLVTMAAAASANVFIVLDVGVVEVCEVGGLGAGR